MAGRRGHNEGSIHQRKDGRWVASIDLGWENGKRKRKHLFADTRKEVAEKLKVVLRDRQMGLPVAVERQTLAYYLERWLTDSVKRTVRPKTYDSYRQVVRLYIVPALGRVQLAQITPQQIEGMLNRLLERGLSPRTVQYCHSVLRRALGQALRWDMVPRNVAKLVDPPRAVRPEVRILTPEESRQFLKSVKGDRLEALYSVAMALGLRQGEALGLRWSDIDLEKGSLSVRVALQRIGGKLQLVEPKSRSSRRTIMLPQVAVTALRTHRVRQKEDRLLAGSRWVDSGMVFTSTIGTPLEPRAAYGRFQEALKRAGIEHIRFHDMRHTCASLLLAQNVHPRVVMAILGHSQISLCMDTYSHVIPSLQSDAAALMDDILGDRAKTG